MSLGDEISKDPKMLGFDPEHADIICTLAVQKLRTAVALIRNARGMLERTGLGELDKGELAKAIIPIVEVAGAIVTRTDDDSEKAKWAALLISTDMNARGAGRGPI